MLLAYLAVVVVLILALKELDLIFQYWCILNYFYE